MVNVSLVDHNNTSVGFEVLASVSWSHQVEIWLDRSIMDEAVPLWFTVKGTWSDRSIEDSAVSSW